MTHPSTDDNSSYEKLTYFDNDNPMVTKVTKLSYFGLGILFHENLTDDTYLPPEHHRQSSIRRRAQNKCISRASAEGFTESHKKTA